MNGVSLAGGRLMPSASSSAPSGASHEAGSDQQSPGEFKKKVMDVVGPQGLNGCRWGSHVGAGQRGLPHRRLSERRASVLRRRQYLRGRLQGDPPCLLDLDETTGRAGSEWTGGA